MLVKCEDVRSVTDAHVLKVYVQLSGCYKGNNTRKVSGQNRCVRGISFTSFYNVYIGFRNCSDNVINFCFSFFVNTYKQVLKHVDK